MCVAILGNSGSGKSTLARWIAGYTYAPLLDLDTVMWEPGKIAVARSPEAARSDLNAFCSAKNHWIVEGCYASLVDTALEYSPRLIFLNPGENQCISNCRARPWEAHKYQIPSRARSAAGLLALLGQSRCPRTTRGTETCHSRDIRRASVRTLAAKSR